MKEKKIVIGNWKMAPTNSREAQETFKNIRRVAGKLNNVQTVICAPYMFIPELKKLVTGHRCVVGAQDVSFEVEDAHTGDVSAEMLKNIGAEYVIVGHSERRVKGETDADVSRKILEVTKKGLFAVVCVGEKERDDEGSYTLFVKKQLTHSLESVPEKSAERIIVAYEPVWAIGKKAKREATLEDVQEMSIFIRKTLIDIFGEKKGPRIPVLYGGSVDQKNAPLYFGENGMNGLLVGRSSLKPAVFEKILNIANS